MRSILLVNDDRPLLELLAIRCQEVGYDADIAIGGKEALELLEKKTYDFVLVDIRMPEMNGVELVQLMKQANIPSQIGAMTGYTESKEAYELYKLGVTQIIPKPIDLEVFSDLIAKFAN